LYARDFKGVGNQYVDEGKCIPESRWPVEVAPTLNAHFGEKQGLEDQHALGGAGLFVPAPIFATSGQANAAFSDDQAQTLMSSHEQPYVAVGQPIAFSRCDNGRDAQVDITPTMRVCGQDGGHLAIAECVGPDCFNGQITGDVATDASHQGGVIVPNVSMAVRRLTPVECERLQGFPDNFTRIPWRNKPAEQCPDGPRYKALGNSMAVPVMRWIGERIQQFEDLQPNSLEPKQLTA
jgi:DNA (cytosine-5)-methyltransferase 1